MSSGTEHQRQREASSWRLQSSRTSLLCDSAWNANLLTNMIAPFLGLWAQLQLKLHTPSGMLTDSFFSSWLKTVSCAMGFFSPGWALLISWLQSSVLGSSQLFFLLTCPFCSHLSTFKYFHMWISQAYLCIQQGILYWVRAIRIVETSMERPKVSHTAIFLMLPDFFSVFLMMEESGTELFLFFK